MTIQPIVEGHGEVAAVPILLRRLALELTGAAVDVAPPIRVPRTQLLRADALVRYVGLARRRADSILILIDADDDCPARCSTRSADRRAQPPRRCPASSSPPAANTKLGFWRQSNHCAADAGFPPLLRPTPVRRLHAVPRGTSRRGWTIHVAVTAKSTTSRPSRRPSTSSPLTRNADRFAEWSVPSGTSSLAVQSRNQSRDVPPAHLNRAPHSRTIVVWFDRRRRTDSRS